MTTKMLEPIVETIIGQSHIYTYEIRMSSLIMYANAFAIYMSIILFLTLDKLQENKTKKINTFYLVTIMWLFIGIISSESRLTFGCLAVVILIYLIINKNDLYNNLKNIIINGILAVIFTAIYFKLINLGMYLAIWILVVLFTILSIILNYLQQKLPQIKIKLNIKVILIIVSLIIVLVIILLNIKSDLILFKGENASNIVRKTLCKIDNKKDYTFKLEIEDKSEIEDNFTISIIEQDKLYNDTKETSIVVDNFSGTKEIIITPLEDTVYSRIYFKSKENTENTELRIKAVYVNDKEVIINYKFLPSELVSKIFTSGVLSRNLEERLIFLKCAIIGGIDNNLLGIGGGGWQYIHSKYQDYNSSITEIHSYIGQLFVEFGGLGLIAYLGIVISLIIKCIKHIKNNGKKITGLMCAILVVVLHSILDFEMSYFLVMLITYMLIAILTSKIENSNKIKINNKIIILIAIIILLPNIIINSKALYSKVYGEPKMLQTTTSATQKLNLQATNVRLNPYNKKYLKTYIKSWQIYRTSIKEIGEKDNIEFIIQTNNLIEKLYKNEPYYLDREISEMLKSNTIMLLKSQEKDNSERYLKLLLKIYSNIGITNRYKVMSIIQQLNSMNDLIQKLKDINNQEWENKFEKLMNEKIELAKTQIEEYEKCGITKKESKEYLQMININENKE